MPLGTDIDQQALLDSLDQAVLIFDSTNRLVTQNRAAETLLGKDLGLLQAEGWAAAKMLFDTRLLQPDRSIDVVRADALDSPAPMRFHTYRAGEYIPCSMSVIRAGDAVYTVISLQPQDWSALIELLGKFIDEARNAVISTEGHADLIAQSLKRQKPGETIEQLSRRIGGFTRIIATHMHRLGVLIDQMERLEAIRTGSLRDAIQEARRKIVLDDYMEDLLEELGENSFLDPEADIHDFRARIKLRIPVNLAVAASSYHLTRILRDLLRNAMMYSMRATPVKITAWRDGQFVQLNVIDEGYGIRPSQVERVFAPFQRAQQPQILGEFGYGLSLYLCKHEIEAMNGRIWFVSEEHSGTTFSLKLPIWHEDSSDMPLEP